MKKCDYCAKEISYDDMYCCDECEKLTKQYYERSDRFAKPFSMINVVCLFGVMAGLFLFPMAKPFGAGLSIVCCAALGILLLLLPFPTESMIKKHKIQKAMKMCRIFGGVVIALGFAVLGMMLIALSA